MARHLSKVRLMAVVPRFNRAAGGGANRAVKRTLATRNPKTGLLSVAVQLVVAAEWAAFKFGP